MSPMSDIVKQKTIGFRNRKRKLAQIKPLPRDSDQEEGLTYPQGPALWGQPRQKGLEGVVDEG